MNTRALAGLFIGCYNAALALVQCQALAAYTFR